MSDVTIKESRGNGKNLAALAGWLLICFSAAAIGGLFPPDQWYRGLIRPSFAPPNWIFGPVWTVLYAMMSVAVWLVWKSAGFSRARTAMIAFAIQLLLNGVWSVLFFGLHSPAMSFIEIIVLWLAIAATIHLFQKHSVTAAILLLPYLAWVSFAAVLNYGFWSLNA